MILALQKAIDSGRPALLLLSVVLVRTLAPPYRCLTQEHLKPSPVVPVVIILASGSEVRRFKPGRGRWIFSERKNHEYDFLRKGSKAVSPVS